MGLAKFSTLFQHFYFDGSILPLFFSCQLNAAQQYSNGSRHLRKPYCHFLENASYHTKGDEKALI